MSKMQEFTASNAELEQDEHERKRKRKRNAPKLAIMRCRSESWKFVPRAEPAALLPERAVDGSEGTAEAGLSHILYSYSTQMKRNE